MRVPLPFQLWMVERATFRRWAYSSIKSNSKSVSVIIWDLSQMFLVVLPGSTVEAVGEGLIDGVSFQIRKGLEPGHPSVFPFFMRSRST